MRYTKEHLSFLRKEYRRVSLEKTTEAFNTKFKTKMPESTIRSVLPNYKIISGRTGFFGKGHVPWNAGSKGLTSANRTSYKKGNIPANKKQINAERFCPKSGVLIKVKERDPYTGRPTRYKSKGVHVWERKNGKVPQGMVVAHKDGNSLNCGIKNLMIISRPELLFLNTNDYKNLPAQLKPSLVALAKMKSLLGVRSRGRNFGQAKMEMEDGK